MTILVLGAGVSGIAAARCARGLGETVRIYDERIDVGVPADLDSVEMLLGDWNDTFAEGVDLVIASPGFPPSAVSVTAIRDAGIDLVAEAQYGIDQIEATLVAVTGTNGKSTVTRVTADMLNAAGIEAVAAGNIGHPLSEVATSDRTFEVVVAELSSFQLELMRVHPHAASILNIAPDHLDWHGTFDAYIDAKASILHEMTAGDLFVSNADDDAVSAIASKATCRIIEASSTRVPNNGNGVEDAMLVIGTHRYKAPTEDPSYRFDLIVAGTLASAVGASSGAVEDVIAAFEPGEHRRNLVGVIDGVRWINDSKATNPHATVAAAESYDRVLLLAGGRNKDLDLSSIGAIPGLAGLYTFGEAGAEIARDAVGAVAVHPSMEDAMRAAAADAEPGDIVLLAPGCTSFDEFTSYAERGERFAEIVHSMEGGVGR